MSHYYHWIGETFLGMWRAWSSYKFASGITKTADVLTVAFRHVYHLPNTPDELNYTWEWEDHAGANRWFMEKLL